MSLKSMGQNAMELVRREGLRSVPHYAYTKFRIFQTRDAQQAHSAARARNEAGYNAWLMAQQPDAAERKRQHNNWQSFHKSVPPFGHIIIFHFVRINLSNIIIPCKARTFQLLSPYKCVIFL